MIKINDYYERLRRIDGALAILADEIDRIQTEIGARVRMTVEVYGEQPADDVIKFRQRIAQAQSSLADARAYVSDGARVAIGQPGEEAEV